MELLVEKEKIYYGDLLKLIEGEILAIRCPVFCPPDTCAKLTAAVQAHKLFGFYTDNPGAGRLGVGVYEILTWEDLVESYLSSSSQVMNALRLGKNSSPADKFMAELALAWPAGIRVPTLKGFIMRPSTARLMNANGPAVLPHDDFQGQYARQLPWAADQKGQLGANIYISVPETGGQLELWCQQLSKEQYDLCRFNRSYGLDRKQLPEPDLTLKPKLGELILINTRKLHAIRGVGKGERCTISSFCGFVSLNDPLLIWS